MLKKIELMPLQALYKSIKLVNSPANDNEIALRNWNVETNNRIIWLKRNTQSARMAFLIIMYTRWHLTGSEFNISILVCKASANRWIAENREQNQNTKRQMLFAWTDHRVWEREIEMAWMICMIAIVCVVLVFLVIECAHSGLSMCYLNMCNLCLKLCAHFFF